MDGCLDLLICLLSLASLATSLRELRFQLLHASDKARQVIDVGVSIAGRSLAHFARHQPSLFKRPDVGLDGLGLAPDPLGENRLGGEGSTCRVAPVIQQLRKDVELQIPSRLCARIRIEGTAV
jgi:hypothetical protein